MDEERRDRSGNPFLRNEKKIVTYSPNQSTFIGDVDRQKNTLTVNLIRVFKNIKKLLIHFWCSR
jgi:hypothetical protein